MSANYTKKKTVPKDEQYEKVIFESNHFIISEEIVEGRKTPILHIYSTEGFALGEIKWYGQLKKFCFYPKSETIWDEKCLLPIVVFLEKYNKEWKQKQTSKSTNKKL